MGGIIPNADATRLFTVVSCTLCRFLVLDSIVKVETCKNSPGYVCVWGGSVKCYTPI